MTTSSATGTDSSQKEAIGFVRRPSVDLSVRSFLPVPPVDTERIKTRNHRTVVVDALCQQQCARMNPDVTDVVPDFESFGPHSRHGLPNPVVS